MKNKTCDFEYIEKLNKQNRYNDVIKYWEGNNCEIDFSDNVNCLYYNYIINSYLETGDSLSAIRLIKIELKKCKNFSIKPINYEHILLILLKRYLDLNKRCKVYKVLLLIKTYKISINKSLSTKLESILNDIESVCLKKPIRFTLYWIYPIVVGFLAIGEGFVLKLFENKITFYFFLLSNFILLILLITLRTKVVNFVIKIFRKIALHCIIL